MGKSATKTVVCVDAHGNQYEVSTDKLRWRPGAYAIVIKDDKLLLSPQFNGYDLPGGGLDLGEMPEAAAIREVEEETGIVVENARFVGVQSNFFKFDASSKGNYLHSISLYFVCDFVGGELTDAGFDEYEKVHSRFPEWVPLSELDSLKVGSSIDWRPFVKQALEK
jgi:8-oxo-dGTP pyrophosphatase MutT (NUDIX family)